MPFEPKPTDETAINTIRTLAADVVGGANSGHPGKKDFPGFCLYSDTDHFYLSNLSHKKELQWV